jgi:hypothetical protein
VSHSATVLPFTRRQSPRLRVDGQLEISMANGRSDAELRDLSLGGFSIWMSTPAPVGELRLFWIGAPGEEPRLFCALAVHSRPAREGHGFVSGWAAHGEVSTRVLQDAMDTLTRAITLEPQPA